MCDFSALDQVLNFLFNNKKLYHLSYQQKNIFNHIRFFQKRKRKSLSIQRLIQTNDTIWKKKENKNPHNFVVYIAYYSLDHNNFKQWKKCSRTFGSSSLGLPVFVARAEFLVPISSWRNTQAFSTALLAEEHAWLFECCFWTSLGATWRTLCNI